MARRIIQKKIPADQVYLKGISKSMDEMRILHFDFAKHAKGQQLEERQTRALSALLAKLGTYATQTDRLLSRFAKARLKKEFGDNVGKHVASMYIGSLSDLPGSFAPIVEHALKQGKGTKLKDYLLPNGRHAHVLTAIMRKYLRSTEPDNTLLVELADGHSTAFEASTAK